jgi:hypothetical protein
MSGAFICKLCHGTEAARIGRGQFLDECRALGARSVTGQEFFRPSVIDYAKDELSIDDIRVVPGRP